MSKRHLGVDEFLDQSDKWRKEIEALRRIVLGCGLTETVKWGSPCYTFEDANVIILGRFKESCVISFIKGALLEDPEGLLVKPGENTQAARVIRFTSLQAIKDLKEQITSFILAAIQVEQSGQKVPPKEPSDEPILEELQVEFDASPEFKAAFEALTPGRRRAYLMFFTAAKQSATRTSRIEKYRQQIFDGKGMNDCTCGLSAKYPQCDGSHKFA